MRGLESHLKGLEKEKEAVLRARSGFEAEKKRAVAKIQQLRIKMTSISSQLTQVNFKLCFLQYQMIFSGES